MWNDSAMLVTLVILLSAAVLLVSVSRKLGFGSILGYLVAGVLVGPSGLRLVTDVGAITDISELGVLMLLFIIGLELRLPRIWAMRRAVFGLGGAQVAVTGAVLSVLAWKLGAPPTGAAILGFGLALSSTAIVLPMLSERKLLTAPAGRDAFAVLLFQDLASIPMIALAPLLAGHAQHGPVWPGIIKAALAVTAILLGGRFLIRPLFRLVGGVANREAFTATALLVVAGAAALAGAAGLPLSLGAFAAGVVLAESEYRHELQADVEPFEGLLLGFFFMSVGMSANVALAIAEPWAIAAGVAGLLGVKIAISWILSRLRGQGHLTALRFALAIPQGSEFAFVLFGAALAAGALARPVVERATLVVALSMLLSPVLFGVSERWLAPALGRRSRRAPDNLDDAVPAPVVICGFGRFGQIVGRVMRTRGIAFNALDAEPDNVDTVRRYGQTVYYGDATRLDLLKAVGADKARVLVIALPTAGDSVKVAELAREHFPRVRLVARARDRHHAHLLMDAGVDQIVRETFFSSLRLTEMVLRGLDFSEDETSRTIQAFRERDEQTLVDQHSFYSDEAQLVQTTRQAAEELRTLFEADEEA